jgi:hypothetical protein
MPWGDCAVRINSLSLSHKNKMSPHAARIVRVIYHHTRREFVRVISPRLGDITTPRCYHRSDIGPLRVVSLVSGDERQPNASSSSLLSGLCSHRSLPLNPLYAERAINTFLGALFVTALYLSHERKTRWGQPHSFKSHSLHEGGAHDLAQSKMCL